MQVDISHFLRAGNRSIIKRNIHFLCCFVFVCFFVISENLFFLFRKEICNFPGFRDGT